MSAKGWSRPSGLRRALVLRWASAPEVRPRLKPHALRASYAALKRCSTQNQISPTISPANSPSQNNQKCPCVSAPDFRDPLAGSEVTSQYLKQDSPQNDAGNRKVNDQSGNINQGSDEGSRCACGIKPAASEQERQHGSCSGPEHHHPHEATSDSERYDQIVRPVRPAQGMPEEYP